MDIIRKTKRLVGKNLAKTVIILAVLVAAIGAVGMAMPGGGVLGKLPDASMKTPVENPLTGRVGDEEMSARPLIVSIDNVGDAVPQSWLSVADLIYEFPVEGAQTRIQAVYYGEFPEEFGPVRSTRPYFVDLTREYKGIFLAHGWSPQAKEYLLSDVVPYINAMNSDCRFYRDSGKAAPHNSYIKWQEVKSKIDEKGWWNEKQDIKPFAFLSGAQKNSGDRAEKISFRYSGSRYEFTYDGDKNLYIRTVDGEKYIDRETGEDITCSNVLLQKVSSSVIDSTGRLSIDMCAGGEATLFTNGVAVKGTWSRDDLDSRTVFTDSEGNSLRLTPGSTWVEVVDQNCTVSY